MARANLIKSKEKSKEYYDRRQNVCEFAVNDWVFILDQRSLKTKFDAEYLGPYQVLEVCNNGNLKINVRGRETVIHANRTKRAHGKFPKKITFKQTNH